MGLRLREEAMLTHFREARSLPDFAGSDF